MKAIILAGGASSRFGSPKAFAEIHEEYFFKKIYHTLESTNMFSEIIISTNEALASEFDGYQVVIDDAKHKNKGPLSGLYSVMKETEGDFYFVISVDTPMGRIKQLASYISF